MLTEFGIMNNPEAELSEYRVTRKLNVGFYETFYY
jgi:hypothetical protein